MVQTNAGGDRVPLQRKSPLLHFDPSPPPIGNPSSAAPAFDLLSLLFLAGIEKLYVCLGDSSSLSSWLTKLC